jgi:hypothetical protein
MTTLQTTYPKSSEDDDWIDALAAFEDKFDDPECPVMTSAEWAEMRPVHPENFDNPVLVAKHLAALLRMLERDFGIQRKEL